MGKRRPLKRVFKDFPQKASASETATTTSRSALEPTDSTHGPSLTANPSQYASGRDLWGLALEKLSKDDKDALSQIPLSSKLDVLQHLHSAAIKKRTECEDRRWKFELNGRQIILRDVAEKIIVWVDKFKQIGDVAVNFDPVHASLPWAGIRFLLEVGLMIALIPRLRLMVKQITVAESQQMGALLTGVEKITPLIGRCQIYEALYLKTEQCEQEDWKSVVKNLTSALTSLYAVMLRFLASAIGAYNQGSFSRTLGAILNPAEVIGFLDKCQTLENSVAIDVDNCERVHTRRIQASSEEQILNLKQALADLQTPTWRIDSRVATLCEKLDSAERLRILEWISSTRYEENHFFACQGRTSGTGRWLLQHERYHEWRASSVSMILWLHGERKCHCVPVSERGFYFDDVRQLALAKRNLFLPSSMIF